MNKNVQQAWVLKVWGASLDATTEGTGSFALGDHDSSATWRSSLSGYAVARGHMNKSNSYTIVVVDCD